MRQETVSSPTVMVIEDIQRSRLAMRPWLERIGYRVLEETNVQDAVDDALDFTGRERPDLILLDLSQGENMSAIRLLRDDVELRDVPIVAFSEYARESSSADTLTEGGNEFMIQPTDVEQLTDLLDNLLPRSSVA